MFGCGDRRFFDRLARLYDLVMPGADRQSLAAGLTRAEGSVDRLLDIGGGTGRATIAVDVPERVVVDISRGMLTRARSRRADGGGGDGSGPLAAVQGDGRQLPVADNAVDAAIIVDAFHHMPAQQTVIREATRVIRPGGVVVIREFDPSHPLGWLLEQGEHAIGMNSTFHTPDSVAELVAEQGWSVSVLDAGFGYTVVGTNR